ncbi:hypothetical protein, partial [Phenylobacterium sp.]|uniref:hypothetical protein n=1 Tax=Phenylobacterium sp. TaxID=1871053 RepID=UPI00286AC33C
GRGRLYDGPDRVSGPPSLRQMLALPITLAIVIGVALFAWQQRRAGAAAERPKTEAALDRAATASAASAAMRRLSCRALRKSILSIGEVGISQAADRSAANRFCVGV